MARPYSPPTTIHPNRYDPDDPGPLNDAEAEALLILLHRYQKTHGLDVVHETPIGAVIEDLAMSMSPTTDLADRIRRDLGA